MPAVSTIWQMNTSGLRATGTWNLENHFNPGRVEEGIFDQAVLDRAHQCLLLLGRELYGTLDPDGEIAEPRGSLELFRCDGDGNAVVCKIARAQVLRCVKCGAGAERSEEELRRSHAAIGATTVLRLIADHGVSPRLDRELYTFDLSDMNFQFSTP